MGCGSGLDRTGLELNGVDGVEREGSVVSEGL